MAPGWPAKRAAKQSRKTIRQAEEADEVELAEFEDVDEAEEFRLLLPLLPPFWEEPVRFDLFTSCWRWRSWLKRDRFVPSRPSKRRLSSVFSWEYTSTLKRCKKRAHNPAQDQKNSHEKQKVTRRQPPALPWSVIKKTVQSL